jgi:hypothetical protein
MSDFNLSNVVFDSLSDKQKLKMQKALISAFISGLDSIDKNVMNDMYIDLFDGLKEEMQNSNDYYDIADLMVNKLRKVVENSM